MESTLWRDQRPSGTGLAWNATSAVVFLAHWANLDLSHTFPSKAAIWARL